MKNRERINKINEQADKALDDLQDKPLGALRVLAVVFLAAMFVLAVGYYVIDRWGGDADPDGEPEQNSALVSPYMKVSAASDHKPQANVWKVSESGSEPPGAVHLASRSDDGELHVLCLPGGQCQSIIVPATRCNYGAKVPFLANTESLVGVLSGECTFMRGVGIGVTPRGGGSRLSMWRLMLAGNGTIAVPAPAGHIEIIETPPEGLTAHLSRLRQVEQAKPPAVDHRERVIRSAPIRDRI